MQIILIASDVQPALSTAIVGTSLVAMRVSCLDEIDDVLTVCIYEYVSRNVRVHMSLQHE